MVRGKSFLALVLSLSLVIALVTMAAPPKATMDSGDRPVIQYSTTGHSYSPSRDAADKYLTLRFLHSSDGGRSWGPMNGTGDTGMLEIVRGDTLSAWNGSNEFGVVVDDNNNLHYIVVLDMFNIDPGLNPSGRVNGVYDAKTDVDGNATYTLIAEETAGNNFTYSDGGRQRNGNLFAMWDNKVTDPDTTVPAKVEIWVARSTDGGANWSAPFLAAGEIPEGDHYPHMTYDVGQNFYVIYQNANDETGLYDQMVVKVKSDLSVTETYATGISSGTYLSYYIGSVNPIAQDVTAGWIYFCIRSDDLGSVTAAFSQDGINWQTNTVGGTQRYPSMGLNTVGGLPYVFSNLNAAADSMGNHKNWYSFDELGYNGGSWVAPIFADTVAYDGVRSLLYCHNGVWTPDGAFVRGCNVWGAATPEGYQVSYLDGEAWSEENELWSIWDEGDVLQAGYITQNHLVAGTGNSVWVALSGRYGASDFDPPVVTAELPGSAMLGQPKVIKAEVRDASFISPVMFNWEKVAHGYDWEMTNVPDSVDIDANTGGGFYYFHLPDSALFIIDENTTEKRVLEPGDHVLFYVDAYDESGNYGAEYNEESQNIWWVNEAYNTVKESDAVAPLRFELGVNYPNPFNSSTMIPFTLSRTAEVKVAVYDLSGREVATLFSGQADAGRHSISWTGEGFTSGIYFYTIEAAGERQVAKMALIR